MSDPEILEPDRGESPSVDPIVDAVQRALPGRTLRIRQDAGQPGFGRQLHIEVEDAGGVLAVDTGPFGSLTVVFASVRFSMMLAPDAKVALVTLEERVRAVADEKIVAFDEQLTPSLRRTAALSVSDGELVGLVDSGIEPHRGEPGPARLTSFRGTWTRAATEKDRKRVDRICGGLVGKLKRKIAIAVLDKATSVITKVMEKPLAIDPQKQLRGRPRK